MLTLAWAVLIMTRVQAEGDPPRPSNDPAYWVTNDDYPTSALRDRVDGMVSFRLSVDATGRVTRCDVVASSGRDDLDNRACEAVSVRARFRPARDAAGNAVESTLIRRVQWTLPPQ